MHQKKIIVFLFLEEICQKIIYGIRKQSVNLLGSMSNFSRLLVWNLILGSDTMLGKSLFKQVRLQFICHVYPRLYSPKACKNRMSLYQKTLIMGLISLHRPLEMQTMSVRLFFHSSFATRHTKFFIFCLKLIINKG